MKIYCPHCGVKGSADDSYSGRKVRCPKCQGMFELEPDMAIDQSELLSADSDFKTPDEVAQGLSPAGGAALAGIDLPETDEQDLAAALGDFEQGEAEIEDELPEEEPRAQEESQEVEEPVVEEESLDWGAFGEELDKEISDGEEEAAETLADLDELLDDELPADDVLIVEDETEGEAEEGENEISPASEEQISDAQSLADDTVEEELPEHDELEEQAGEIEQELEDVQEAQEDIAGAFDDVSAAADVELEELREEKDDPPEEDDSKLGTLSAVAGAAAAAAPLFAGDEKKDEEKESGGAQEGDEVMAFAEADLPGAEEEAPDVIIGDDDGAVEDEPYGIAKEQCWQCGKEDSVGEPFVAIDGRLYCTECSPGEEATGPVIVEPPVQAEKIVGAGEVPEENVTEDEETSALRPDFTVGGVMKDAWNKVKGIKGAVWAGSAVMYLILIVIAAGGSMILPSSELEVETLASYIPSALFQFITQALYMIFMGGLFFMGIRRVAGDGVSWKMIFHGFSFTGKIVVVTILQSILITIGFIFLILPGIYLTVGYAMAIPLIVDKNLSPWEALETSRKAVHKVWWKVAAIGLISLLLFLVASIPLGLGLIWVWPLVLVVTGVVYHRLFNK